MALEMYCQNCGHIGEPKRYIKGSVVTELLLWFCFLLPGLIYSIWRANSRFKGCPNCEAPNMVPLNSPKAREMMKK